jgi:hypothetical protein
MGKPAYLIAILISQVGKWKVGKLHELAIKQSWFAFLAAHENT